jgi:Flp pilus assembly pilin Flp
MLSTSRSTRAERATERCTAVACAFARLVQDESGSDMMEYGLILSLIALSCIAGANGVANQVHNMINTVTNGMNSAV